MTKDEIKALINEKIVANTSGNITAEVLNDILQNMLYAEDDVEPTFTACYGLDCSINEEDATNIGEDLSVGSQETASTVIITGNNMSNIKESDLTASTGTVEITSNDGTKMEIIITPSDYGTGNLYYKSTLLCVYEFME